MERKTEISAIVSAAAKALHEKRVRATEIEKGHLVEEGLRHHLQAINELPTDVIISPTVVVSRSSAEELANRLASRPRPTKALRVLMSSGD